MFFMQVVQLQGHLDYSFASAWNHDGLAVTVNSMPTHRSSITEVMGRFLRADPLVRRRMARRSSTRKWMSSNGCTSPGC